MNVAFSAIVLLLALLPGIVFRYAYLKSNSIRRSINTGILSEVALILVAALAFHLVAIPVGESLSGKVFLFDQFFYLIVPPKSDDLLKLTKIYGSLYRIGLYLFLASAFAFGLAKFLRYVVVRLELDRTHKFLRIYNAWDRYFTGHELPKEARDKVDAVMISVVVVIGNAKVLYKGVLESYTLSDPYGIDQLTLSEVYRRDLEKDLKHTVHGDSTQDHPGQPTPLGMDDRYYPIPGDFFMIPFENVENFNITYVTVAQVEEE